MTQQEAQIILYQALGARAGLLIQSSDPKQAVQRFYAARRALGDSDLSRLQFRQDSRLPDGNLVITKGKS